MLNADIDSLFDIAVADPLVYYYPDGALGHIVDNTRLAMVDFVGHAVQNLGSPRNKRVESEHRGDDRLNLSELTLSAPLHLP